VAPIPGAECATDFLVRANSPKNAPPGRKVGMLRPKHTGRNK